MVLFLSYKLSCRTSYFRAMFLYGRYARVPGGQYDRSNVKRKCPGCVTFGRSACIQPMRAMLPVSLLHRIGQKAVRGRACFLRKNARALAYWPLLFLVLTAILWAWVSWVSVHEKTAIRERLFISA